MATFDYNPITGNLDLVGSGASYINGVVADPTALPVTLGTPPLDSVYLAKAGSGVWLINRKPAGLYCRTANNGVAADWTYLGAFPEVNADGNWELYNSADPTKELKFDLSGLPTATTRTVTAPAGNGQMLVEGQSIGATTRNTGAFTTLSTNNGTITVDSPALVVAQDSASATAFNLAEFRMTGGGTTNSNLIRALSNGSQVFGVRRNGIIDTTQLSWGNAWLLAGGNVSLPSGAYFGFTSSTSGFSGQDTFIRRDAASTIAFRDLANPQTFRIYNTTDAGLTNFERGFIGWSSNTLRIGTEAGGTGSARNLEIRAGAATYTFTTPFTASPNNTVNHVSIQAAGDTTNVSLSLVPKGSGALSARVPTGTGGAGGGGNARGAGAVDWQISTDSFTAAADVASGTSAVICGGVRNRCNGTEGIVGGGSGNNASSTKSAILCGNTNTASGSFGTVLNGDSSQATGDCALAHGRTAIASGTRSVAIGETATASAANSLAFGANVLANRIGMQAYAAGQFAAQGDAQRARFVLRCKTTTNAAVEMALDGGTTYLTIPNGKVMFCNIKVVGIRSDGVTVATYERQYAAKNLANVSSEVFAPVTIGTDLASGTTLEVATVDAGDYIRIRPTGVLNEVWRWVASVDAVECSYGT